MPGLSYPERMLVSAKRNSHAEDPMWRFIADVILLIIDAILRELGHELIEIVRQLVERL